MAFEEIKAKLGLDITAFEKGMLDANRAAKQAAAAQAKLADFRRAKALEEASDLGKVKILQGELVQLYNLRKTAVAGSAPYLAAQLEIEKKMLEIGRARAQQKANEAQAQQAAAKAAAQTAAAQAKPLPQVEQDKGIGGLFKGATDKLLNLQMLGNTVATALGLNIQSIAEGVARFVVGFSQTQEDALNRLVDRSKTAADELTQIANKRRVADDPQKRIDLLNDEEASLRLVTQGTAKLTAAEKYRILLREGPFTAGAVVAREEEAMAQQIEDARNRIGQIGRERLIAEDDLKKKNAENEKKSTDEVAKNFAAAAEERKKRTLAQMSDEDKLKALTEEQTQALKDYNDTSKTAVERSEAHAKAEQLATEIQKTTNDIAKKANDAAAEQAAEQAKLLEQDKARTEELKKQRSELESQAKLKAEEIRAARIQEVKPTMEEVTSGKRNIGIGAKENARRLQREQAKSLRLADQTQRAAEAIDQAKTPSERRDAQRAYNASRLALEASQERIKRGQELLGNRIVNANPFMNMEVELGNIKTELENINTKLESTAIK